MYDRKIKRTFSGSVNSYTWEWRKRRIIIFSVAWCQGLLCWTISTVIYFYFSLFRWWPTWLVWTTPRTTMSRWSRSRFLTIQTSSGQSGRRASQGRWQRAIGQTASKRTRRLLWSDTNVNGRCAITVGTGWHWSPTFRLGRPTMYWSPQLLGRSFQKARNFTARSHQNAGFSIWVFIFFGEPDPHSEKGARPSHTQHPARPLAGWARGASAPVLGPKPWSPQLFSRGCAPVVCVGVSVNRRCKHNCIFVRPSFWYLVGHTCTRKSVWQTSCSRGTHSACDMWFRQTCAKNIKMERRTKHESDSI